MPATPLVLDQKAANQLNLQVLKRIDPATEDVRPTGPRLPIYKIFYELRKVLSTLSKQVLATAGHVALYDFNQDSSCWVKNVLLNVLKSQWKLALRTRPLQERKDVEGSLFLLKRRTNPRFQFIILNKKSQGKCAVWTAPTLACTLLHAVPQLRSGVY